MAGQEREGCGARVLGCLHKDMGQDGVGTNISFNIIYIMRTDGMIPQIHSPYLTKRTRLLYSLTTAATAFKAMIIIKLPLSSA